MKFLNERQIGFHPSGIGFPNLGDCMALVVHDTGGLFGFHLTRGDLKSATLFVKWVRDHLNYQGHMVGLYTACYHQRRYGQSATTADWKAELTSIADALVYKGDVNGFNLAKSGIGGNEPIYAAVNLAGGSCTITYKRMSKMTPTGGPGSATDDDIRELAPDPAARKALFEAGRGAEWDVNNPIRKIDTKLGRGDTAHMAIKTTRSNKGLLHTAKALDQFTV